MLGPMMHRRNVSFRRFGPNGEYRRPLFHRFEVKGGVSGLNVMIENIYSTSPLLRALYGR